MALQKQKVQLNITDGIDTKTDAPSVLVTKFLEAENVTFGKLGSAHKRLGNSKLSDQVLTGGTIASGTSLAKFNNQLVMTDNTNLYTYSPAVSKWIDQGTFNHFSSSSSIRHSSGNGIVATRHAATGNLIAYTFRESVEVGGASATTLIVVDKTTDTIILTRYMSGYCDIASTSSGFFVVDLSNAYFLSANTLAFTTVGTTYSNSQISLVTDGTYAYVACCGTNSINIRKFSTSGIVSQADVSLAYTPSVIKASLENSNANLRVCCGNNAVTQIPQTFVRSTANLNTAISGPTALSTTAIIYSITAIQSLASSTESIILFTTSTNLVKKVTASSSGTISATTTVYEDSNLVSDLALFNGNHYFAIKPALKYVSIPIPPLDRTSGAEKQTMGATTYILESKNDTDWKIVSSCDKENTVPYSMRGQLYTSTLAMLSSLIVLDSTTLSLVNIAYAAIARTSVTTVIDWTPAELTVHNISPSTAIELSKVNSQNQLLYNGALPLLYDGTAVTENGFIDRPQITDIQTTTTLAVGFPTGTYRFYVVWVYKDSNGYEYRSAPSDPQYVQVTASNIGRIYVYTKLPQYTLKPFTQLEIYMTLPTGTVYFKLNSSFAEYQAGSSRFIVQGIVDDVLADVAAGETLYTTGGALENDALPPSYHVVSHKNRIFSINDDRQTISYSQLLNPGVPIAFNAALQLNIPEAGGKLTGIGSLDNYLIIFKESSIYAISGDGPNNLGQQDNFTEPQLVVADAGCINKNSIIYTPDGVLFNSGKGIYLLARNLSVSYRGAAVEAYNGDVLSTVMMPETNEIRFSMDSGIILVHDYFTNRWSIVPEWATKPTIDFLPAVDMIIGPDNVFHQLTSNGKVYKQATDVTLPVSFTDDGGSTYVPIKLTSSWVSFAGLQGYQRLYKLLILATYKTPHKLKISFAYNMSDTYVDYVIVDTAVSTDTNFYNLEIRPKRQKCSMVKFKIEELPPDTGTYGEGLVISGLAMELGVKVGLNKTVNTYGAT